MYLARAVERVSIVVGVKTEPMSLTIYEVWYYKRRNTNIQFREDLWLVCMFVWVFVSMLNYSLCVPALDSDLDRSSICDCNLLKNQHHTRLPSAQIMQNIHFPFLQKSTHRTGESVLRLQITNHWFCSKWIIIESLVTIVNLANKCLSLRCSLVLCCVLSLWVSWQTSFADWQRPQRQKYLSTRHIKWQDGNTWQGFFVEIVFSTSISCSRLCFKGVVFTAPSRALLSVCVCVCVSKWREGLCCTRIQIVSNFK